MPVLADPRRHFRLKPYQRLLWGYPEPSRAGSLPPRIETEDHVFEVLETPGRAPDHVCLFELEEKISYLTELGDRVRDLRARGLRYGTIRRKLFGTPPLIAWLTLGDFSGTHLVRSLVEDRPEQQ